MRGSLGIVKNSIENALSVISSSSQPNSSTTHSHDQAYDSDCCSTSNSTSSDDRYCHDCGYTSKRNDPYECKCQNQVKIITDHRPTCEKVKSKVVSSSASSSEYGDADVVKRNSSTSSSSSLNDNPSHTSSSESSLVTDPSVTDSLRKLVVLGYHDMPAKVKSAAAIRKLTLRKKEAAKYCEVTNA